MHKIGKTAQVTLEGKRFKLELAPHHFGKSSIECEGDCPKGWQMPPYFLLQNLRNNPKTRVQFGLEDTFEFVQHPDVTARTNGYVARFGTGCDGADLNCNRDEFYKHRYLGVRYAREIPQ